VARDILESGRALEKFNAILDAQGRNHHLLTLGNLSFTVLAPRKGVVSAINNFVIAHIARLAGAPMDQGAGVKLHKKLGDSLKKGAPLYTIYAEFEADFEFAKQAAQHDCGFVIQ